MLEQGGTIYRGDGDARSIAQRLSALKERGCVTAATGDAPSEVMQGICRRMFGDPNLDRRRLLVTFRRDPTPDEWLPADLTVDHETVTFRDRSEAAREVAARTTEQPGSDAGEGGVEELARSHLDATAGDVVDVAADLVSTQPGRVRIVVLRPDLLFPNPDRQSLASLREFVTRLRTLMQRFGGMGLLVVPDGDDARIVTELREEVDIQFEVRSRSSFVEQRVIVAPGSGDSLGTDWHELD